MIDAQSSTQEPLKTAVQLEDTDKQGYMASLEFFHQIHCLVREICALR